MMMMDDNDDCEYADNDGDGGADVDDDHGD